MLFLVSSKLTTRVKNFFALIFVLFVKDKYKRRWEVEVFHSVNSNFLLGKICSKYSPVIEVRELFEFGSGNF